MTDRQSARKVNALSLSARQLVAATGGRLTRGKPTRRVIGISIDTRTIQLGELYIAIVGKSLDGHNFVAEAFRKGAAGAVVNDGSRIANAGSRSRPLSFVISVPDTTRALGDIAAWHRRRFSPKVVGIVGSNGKSTTKEMLAAILGRRFKVLKPAGSFNNDIGVPLTILAVNRHTQAAVIEMEMNEIGGIRRLCEIAQPEIGVVTNIGDTHLEFLLDRQGVAAERSELIEYIAKTGTAILNADDPLVMQIGKRFPARETITFGRSRKADLYATRIRDLGLSGVTFALNGKVPVRLKVPGLHNVHNALAAIAAAGAVGFATREAIEGIEQFPGMPMRLQVERRAGLTLIVDCYNANPQSMAAALEVLAQCRTGRRIVVLGDMNELGAAARGAHRQLGQQAGRVADVLVVRGRFAAEVASGARKAGLARRNVVSLRTNREVSQKLIDTLGVGDTILIKGSRANLLEEVVRDLRTRYGDKQTGMDKREN
jgi:UDP-N-acetylmuramoyl-tripeptide--D-alanyl-D-alanine ligase